MSIQKYTINWTDDSLKAPFDIAANARDVTHSSLTLIGGGKIEWGKEYQENMIHLLENFASNSKPPHNPTVGQLWFNAADNILKIYESANTWKDIKNRRIDSFIAPKGISYPGDLWYESGTGYLRFYKNEGIWSDPISGSVVIPPPIPVTPTPAPTTPAPTTTTPVPTTTSTPTPSPTSTTPAPTTTSGPTTTPAPTTTAPPPTTPAPTQSPTAVQPFGQSGSYTLAFQDEFTNGSLDFTKWNDHIWYEQSNSTINYSQENGSLFIWPDSGFVNRTIDTDGKYEQLYGYFEIEAKLPIGKGCWPAFWLYAHPNNGNKSRPEIDIMEAYSGGGPNTGWSDSNLHPNNYGMTLHQANADYSYSVIPYSIKLADVQSTVDLSAGFHKYAVMWESNGISFYFDGKLIGNKWSDSSSYFDQPMYILLDLWFGSASGSPDSSTPTGISNAFEVRYVRAWNFGITPTPAPTTTAPPSTTTPPSSTTAPPTSTTAPPTTTPAPTSSVYKMPAHSIDYFGTSFVWGYDGASGNRVAKPVPQILADAFPQLYVKNEGVNSSDTTKLLNGTDGVHPDFDTVMSRSTANVVIIGSFGFSDSMDLTMDEWKSHLNQIYSIATRHGKLVVFVTVHRTDPAVGDTMGPYAAAMGDVAASLGAGFIEMFNYTVSKFTGNIRDWVPDGYHPTQTGYYVIGNHVIDMYPAVYKKLTGVSTPQVDPNQPAPFGQDSTLYPNLVFEDEFNGTSLDTAKWSLGLWYETPNSLNNYTVSNGSLTVWPVKNSDGSWEPHNFTITTDTKIYMRYGYIEVEAKLPVGTAVWPSFWLYAHNDSTRPTINVMQTWPADTTDSYGDSNLHPRNYIASADTPSLTSVGTRKLLGSLFNDIASAPDLSGGFHKYAVRWDSSGITFYFDGQPLGSKMMTSVMTQKMFLIIDLWLGDKAGQPDANTPTTASQGLSINYIRAWELSDGTSQFSGSWVGSAPVTTYPPSTTPAPSTIIVDYYGDSTIYGADGDGSSRVSQPAPAVFAADTGYTTHNEGVNRSSSTQLLNGTDGVHPSWDTQMTNSTATHVIINHAINDWDLSQTAYKSNLQQLINIAKNHGKKVILETPNPTYQTLSGGSAASDQALANKAQYMREVAFSAGVGLIDQFKYLTDYMSQHNLTTQDLIPDGLNPNQSTYNLKGHYAAQIFASIK